jgi:energy-coupling factor transporter ATP-binding protein EcfA2
MAPWIPVALPPRFAAARQVRIVGRRYELEVMETVWERVVQGHGQVVLLGGEPGAGKSRLAAELAGALHDRDVAVLVGNATKDAGVPYQPFVEMLDQLFLAADPGSLTDVLGDGGADLRRLKTLCVTSYFRAIVSYLVGRPHDLAEAASDLRREARPTGQAWHNYFAGCLAQGRAFLGGDFAQAEQWAERTLRLGDAFGVDTTDGSYGVQMFMIRRETGGLDVARRHLTGQASFAGRWIPGLLALYTELDIAEGTRRTLRHLLDRDLASHTTEAQWPIELAFMTEGALALGDRAAAGVLRPFLDAYAGMNLVGGQFVAVFGSADRFLGRIAALLDDPTGAERHFAAALAMDRRMASVVHIAETLADHALVLHAAGTDPSRARDLAARARALAEPIGQVRVLRRLEALHRSPGPHRLTAREVEVIELLAEGLSNREIGARLFISANTPPPITSGAS